MTPLARIPSEVLKIMELKHKVRFVTGDAEIWPELGGDSIDEIDEARLAELSVEPFDCWILRTYYEMARAGLDVTLGPKPLADAINIAMYFGLARPEWLPDVFAVGVRADGHFPRLADFVITQNSNRAGTAKVSALPHWPQPGLIPRSQDRGRKFERIGFFGFFSNLAETFKQDEFREQLDRWGLVLDVKGSAEADQVNRGSYGTLWRDYSEVDAVFAVRAASPYVLRNKPASKLVNAWFADVPAVLSDELGYRDIRRSPLDCFIVKDYEDAVRAIEALKADPALRKAMVDNGRARRLEFSKDKVLQAWIAIINGSIHTAFRNWARVPSFIRYFGLPSRIALERIERRHHRREFHRSATSFSIEA